jgi:uncharacterized protein (TIGR02611 family)
VLDKPMTVIRFIGRSSRRIGVTIAGFAVLLAGGAMLVLPGPGWVVIFLGLAILATEYAWADAALDRSKKYAAKAGGVAKSGAGRAVGAVRRKRS